MSMEKYTQFFSKYGSGIKYKNIDQDFLLVIMKQFQKKFRKYYKPKEYRAS